jgi:CRISPR/Cas system-associated protein Csm6
LARGYDYGMGRPKKPEGEVRENFLRIRLTDAERAALDNEAQARGEETSTWARRMLLALARPVPAPKRK